MIKLYRTWSTLGHYRGHKDVRVNWFCDERKAPVLPYQDALGYDVESLADRLRSYAVAQVDQYLTSEEVAQLRAFMEASDGPWVEVKEEPVPLQDNCASYNAVDADGSGEPQGFIELYRFAGYNLDIPVRGYYDLRGADGPYNETNKVTRKPSGVGAKIGELYQLAAAPFSQN